MNFTHLWACNFNHLVERMGMERKEKRWACLDIRTVRNGFSFFIVSSQQSTVLIVKVLVKQLFLLAQLSFSANLQTFHLLLVTDNLLILLSVYTDKFGNSAYLQWIVCQLSRFVTNLESYIFKEDFHKTPANFSP